MKPSHSAYKEGEGQQGQQARLPLRHREVAWGGRRTSEQFIPKRHEAAKLGEVAGSLQLSFVPNGMLSAVS